MAPLSTTAQAAIERYVALWADDPIRAYREYPHEQADLLRAEIAGLIGARAEDVAIVDGTSRGNNLAVQMIDTPVGANVVVDATTYPTALLPWQLRPVELRRVSSSDDGTPSLTDFRRLIDEDTVAVSVSHVCRLSGFRHDLRALAEIAHAAGAALVVDAAQSVGVVPIDVDADGIDFLSFGAMKWLLGVPGIAFFYVRPELQDAVPHVGGSGKSGDERIAFPTGAARHQLSSLNWAGLEGSRCGLALLAEVGREEVEARVLALSDRVINGLLERGARVRTPRDPDRRAGIVAFECPSAGRLQRFLREHCVDVWGWEQRQLVRVDPHIYNNDDDIARFLAGYDAFPGAGASGGTRRARGANAAASPASPTTIVSTPAAKGPGAR